MQRLRVMVRLTRCLRDRRTATNRIRSNTINIYIVSWHICASSHKPTKWYNYTLFKTLNYTNCPQQKRYRTISITKQNWNPHQSLTILQPIAIEPFPLDPTLQFGGISHIQNGGRSIRKHTINCFTSARCDNKIPFEALHSVHCNFSPVVTRAALKRRIDYISKKSSIPDRKSINYVQRKYGMSAPPERERERGSGGRAGRAREGEGGSAQRGRERVRSVSTDLFAGVRGSRRWFARATPDSVLPPAFVRTADAFINFSVRVARLIPRAGLSLRASRCRFNIIKYTK